MLELGTLFDGATPPPPPAGLDPERFDALCQAHHVEGAVARAPGVPGRSALTRRHRADFARSIGIEQRRNQAVLAAAEVGADALVLKGADWAFRLYPDPGMRPMVDVDLLAPPGRTADIVRALEGIGYRIAPGEEGFLAGGYTVGMTCDELPQVRIEVHPELCRQSRYSIDVQGLFERSSPLSDDLAAGRRMHDVDGLLYCAVHHALHGYRMPLLWLLDFALLAHRCGPDQALAARAQSWGAVRALSTSRRLAESLWGPLPLGAGSDGGGGYLEALVSADHLRMNRFDDDRQARASSAVALLDRGRVSYLLDTLSRRIKKK